MSIQRVIIISQSKDFDDNAVVVTTREWVKGFVAG